MVELTEFVPRGEKPASDSERGAALSQYVTDVLRRRRYDVVRTESAVLPLRVRPERRKGNRVLAIGTTAGLVKATTGYAYSASSATAPRLRPRWSDVDIPSTCR